MEVISVKSLTKVYGGNRGIFDVSFDVNEGETLGFLGPNGAGKTTTIRHLMGFTRPQNGSSSILGKDCFSEYAEIKKHIGYLPGEVSLPSGLSGNEFINMMSGLRGKRENERIKYLVDLFKLDLEQNVKKMSIGEKRKLAIVTAFMNDPKILLLDEPTSGLDPIMQEVFVDFIREEKKRGKTILLSSHIFSEVDALCDRIAIIKDGKIVSIVSAEQVKHGLRKTFELTFESQTDFNKFLKEEEFEIKGNIENKKWLSIVIEDKNVNKIIKRIINYRLAFFEEKSITLEDYFMDFYKSNRSFKGGF